MIIPSWSPDKVFTHETWYQTCYQILFTEEILAHGNNLMAHINYIIIHKYIHTYIRTCIYTYIHTYIHTHTHTHIHRHTYMYVCVWERERERERSFAKKGFLPDTAATKYYPSPFHDLEVVELSVNYWYELERKQHGKSMIGSAMGID